MAKDSASSIPNPALYNPYGYIFHQMTSTPHWCSYQLRVPSFPDQNYPRSLARKALDNRLTEVFERPHQTVSGKQFLYAVNDELISIVTTQIESTSDEISSYPAERGQLDTACCLQDPTKKVALHGTPTNR